MDFDEVKKYWEERAQQKGKELRATTDDHFLRELEIRKLNETIKKFPHVKSVADIGCGDGYSTLELAKEFPHIEFIGYDYSASMIELANKRREEQSVSNVTYAVLDIVNDPLTKKFDIIYTDRVIINLPSWDVQRKSIEKIFEGLNTNGVYIMIENFLDGQNNFNDLREQFGLDKIEVRPHNLFLDMERLRSVLEDKGRVHSVENISSLYYIVSRIVYSKMCQLTNVKPDYMDIHHELGAQLPSAGNYGPISMIVTEKR